MRIPLHRFILAAGALLLAFVLGTLAQSSPFYVQGVIPTTAPTDVSIPAIRPMVGGAVVRTFEMKLDQGQAVGFHYHTGPVYNIIQSGTLTEDDGCGNIETHSAGDAFFEGPGHIHEVRNEQSEPVIIWATIIHSQTKPGTVRVSGPKCAP